ncbi:flagellar hook protein, partial [Sphingomonadaceae bacterium]|nr:flagellar hook protein [Sphingomonadaceae bacterium]
MNALGAGSGVDMIELAENLAEVRFATQRARLEASNELLDTQISSASTLRSQLTQLSSALGDRIRTGDLAPTVTISNVSVASVAVAATSAGEGTYSLEVTQLAGAQTLASKTYTSAEELVGEGTLSIRFGTVSGASFTEDATQTALSIDVTASDTLETLADKINQSGGAVSAYVATNAGGAQLVIRGQEGAAGGFVVEGQSNALIPANQAGDLSYLSWEPASDQGQLRQSASDAAFLFDGVEITRRSNEVSGLPAGLSLSLTATNIGAPAQIGFGSASGEIADVMND